MLGYMTWVRKPGMLTSSHCLCCLLLQMLVSLLYASVIMPFLSLSDGLLPPVHLEKSSCLLSESPGPHLQCAVGHAGV